MIKKFYGFVMLISSFVGAYAADQENITQEIKQIVARTKLNCAQLVYDVVRQEIDMVRMSDDTTLSLFEQVVPVFVTPHMRKIIKISSAYCSEATVYELAARLAAQANDIDSLIVLSIAAGQKRTSCYTKSFYTVGIITGLLAMWGARFFYDNFVAIVP